MGTRRRFLYRLIIYPLLPLLALWLILSRLGDRDSDLVGLLGLILGLVALYFFFGRLKRPLVSVRYALNPLRAIRQALGHRQNNQAPTSSHELQGELQRTLQAALPDVVVTEVSLNQGEARCLRVGDEVLVCCGSSLKSIEEADALAIALGEARTPLHEEAVLLMLRQPTDQSLLARLQERLPRLSLINGM